MCTRKTVLFQTEIPIYLKLSKISVYFSTWKEANVVPLCLLQEIEPHVGESLSKLFTLDGSSDYERVISRVKRKREALQALGPLPTIKSAYRLDMSGVVGYFLSSIIPSTFPSTLPT